MSGFRAGSLSVRVTWDHSTVGHRDGIVSSACGHRSEGQGIYSAAVVKLFRVIVKILTRESGSINGFGLQHCGAVAVKEKKNHSFMSLDIGCVSLKGCEGFSLYEAVFGLEDPAGDHPYIGQRTALV